MSSSIRLPDRLSSLCLHSARHLQFRFNLLQHVIPVHFLLFRDQELPKGRHYDCNIHISDCEIYDVLAF